jgi:hypothetical protein
MSIQNCVNNLLIRGAEDLVQAAEVASVAITVGGAVTPEDVLDLSLRTIREVLQRGLMRIGDAVGGGQDHDFSSRKVTFVPWSLPIDMCLNRLENEWKSLGRNPELGEICWLENTSEGSRIAQDLFH